MTIDYVVKKQAIDLHLQGRGRNEIARILNGQKMRISEATITHLIQNCKRQQSNSEPSSQLNSVQVNIESDVLINQDVTSQHEQSKKRNLNSHSNNPGLYYQILKIDQ